MSTLAKKMVMPKLDGSMFDAIADAIKNVDVKKYGVFDKVEDGEVILATLPDELVRLMAFMHELTDTGRGPAIMAQGPKHPDFYIGFLMDAFFGVMTSQDSGKFWSFVRFFLHKNGIDTLKYDGIGLREGNKIVGYFGDKEDDDGGGGKKKRARLEIETLRELLKGLQAPGRGEHPVSTAALDVARKLDAVSVIMPRAYRKDGYDA